MIDPINPDPQRPLQLAIRSARLMGIVSALFGTMVVFAFGYFNRYQRYQIHFIALGMIAWVIPGVLLVTYSLLMQQKRRRSAIGALAVASTQGLFALAALIANFYLTPISPVPVLLCALWLAASLQLLFHLRRSLPLLQSDADRLHGFDLTPSSVPLPSVPLRALSVETSENEQTQDDTI